MRPQSAPPKKNLLKGIGSLILAAAVDAGAIYFRHDKFSQMIPAIMISLLFWWYGVYMIRSYVKANKAYNDGEYSGMTELERRIMLTKTRKKGKDMFAVCDGIALGYKILMIVVLIVFAFTFPFAITMKLNDYPSINIPYYWGFIIGVVIIIISAFFGLKNDIGYISSKELRKVIREKDYDEVRVNIDFMMATYHDMEKGILAIGQSYYVVFMQKFCDVGDYDDLIRVESYYRKDVNPTDETPRYFVRIITSKMRTSLMCEDKIAAELVLREFEMKGMATRECGDETGKYKKKSR